MVVSPFSMVVPEINFQVPANGSDDCLAFSVFDFSPQEIITKPVKNSAVIFFIFYFLSVIVLI